MTAPALPRAVPAGVASAAPASQVPVFVINLPRDADRLRAMTAQLRRLRLDFERVAGVVGRELSPAEQAAIYDAARNRREFHLGLVAGEIGCYASHLKVWQQVVDRGIACALVLEDDVALGDALPATLAAVAALPPRWDMIKLIGRARERPWQRRPLVRERVLTIDLIRYRRVPSLTGAYLVSADGARRLLAARRSFARPVDTDIRHWWECGLRLFGAYPYPVRNGSSAAQSSIGRREEARSLSHRMAIRLHKWWLQVSYSLHSWWANARSAGQLAELFDSARAPHEPH